VLGRSRDTHSLRAGSSFGERRARPGDKDAARRAAAKDARDGGELD
jgi:hypothetical protein